MDQQMAPKEPPVVSPAPPPQLSPEDQIRWNRSSPLVRQLGDPALTTRAREVEIFDNVLRNELDQMVRVMVALEGAGLAAPQLGTMSRMFVYRTWAPETDDAQPPVLVINPEVIQLAEEKVVMPEGCLSIPGVVIRIERPSWVHFRYQDETGKLHQHRAEGWEARVILHEWAHLEGKLITQYVKGADLRLALQLFKQASSSR